MKLNETLAAMPSHWRTWNLEEKAEWCQSAISATKSSLTVEHLSANLDAAIGEKGFDTIDHTTLSQLAAMIITIDA